jgi:arylsulfatase A-like enzyme
MLSILITLDCVRADYLEGRGLTPELDGLAPEWTTFSEAFAQSQNTLSSHLSLLTSNYLFQHGVYSNFVHKALPPHALPARLREKGFETRAFCGIEFLALLLGNQVGPADPRFPPAEDRSLSARLKRRWRGNRRDAGAVTDAGMEWLSGLRGRDAFLWLHCFDAHMVYEAPRPLLERHLTGGVAQRTVREQLRERGWFSPDFAEYGRRLPLEHFPQRYAAAVAHLDRCLGAFFAELKSKGWWDDALVVVTSDHGECLLGDHAVYCAHKKLFDTTVKVPLRVKFPGGAHAGERVESLVQHVDIAPTVAAASGTGDALYMGRDLGAVAAGRDPGHGACFSEHVDNFLRAARDRDLVFVEQVPGAQNKWGLRMEEGSLFLRDGSPAPAGSEGRAAALKDHLDSVLASGAEGTRAWGTADGTDADVAERLKSLGYM